MRYIGIDIGGTSIKGGLVDESGILSKTRQIATPIDDLDALLAGLDDMVVAVGNGANIDGIGIGIPGLRSARTGNIETSPNIPCLQQVNIEAALTRRLGIPVVTENDAKAAAYGEFACGSGRGVPNMVVLTLGTGLGCGLILGGKLYRGTSGFAGELGHTTVEPQGRRCACGSMGCLETRVSAPGIVRTARELLAADQDSLLHSAGETLTAEGIYEAALQGDHLARTAFAETGRFLGIACANIINLLNPERIVVGGGVMASGNMLLDAAANEVRRRAFAPSIRDCTIVQSGLWPDAGMIGAAMLARDRGI